MGLIAGTHDVFTFLSDFYSFLPLAIRILIDVAFGGILFLAVLKNINR